MNYLKNWIHQHPLLFTGVFTIIYFTWFMLLEEFRHPVLYLKSPLDQVIPFCEYFIIPYLGWFIYIGITFIYFLIYDRENFYHVSRYMFTGMILCLIIYTILPTGLRLRPYIVHDNLCSRLVELIYTVDTSTNVCPSIHVFNSIAVNTVIQHCQTFKHPKLVHTLSFVFAILICMSTVFLKQHSVIDVFWGVVLGLILYPLSYRSISPTSVKESLKVHIS